MSVICQFNRYLDVTGKHKLSESNPIGKSSRYRVITPSYRLLSNFTALKQALHVDKETDHRNQPPFECHNLRREFGSS